MMVFLPPKQAQTGIIYETTEATGEILAKKILAKKILAKKILVAATKMT
jgi:hypothetical protein